MAWIESHQQLENHPKRIRLQSLMNISKNETIGMLHRFWWWCVDYAEDGDLRKYNDSEIAIAVGLNSDQGQQFIESMVESGWIDRNPYFRIHDWWDYVGRFLQTRYKHNPNRWKKIQKLYNNRSKNRSKNYKPNQPNLTKPNQPNLISEQNKILLDSFGEKIKEKIIVYIDRVKTKNKSGVITEGRRNTLLTELFNSRERCGNDSVFDYALDQAVSRDACNIGYINAIIKNKKTQKPKEDFREYYVAT